MTHEYDESDLYEMHLGVPGVIYFPEVKMEEADKDAYSHMGVNEEESVDMPNRPSSFEKKEVQSGLA